MTTTTTSTKKTPYRCLRRTIGALLCCIFLARATLAFSLLRSGSLSLFLCHVHTGRTPTHTFISWFVQVRVCVCLPGKGKLMQGRWFGVRAKRQLGGICRCRRRRLTSPCAACQPLNRRQCRGQNYSPRQHYQRSWVWRLATVRTTLIMTMIFHQTTFQIFLRSTSTCPNPTSIRIKNR